MQTPIGEDEESDLWVFLPKRALGAVIGVLCGGAFVWFHEGSSLEMNPVSAPGGAASPTLLGVYAACCFATTLFCLLRPGPSMWPLLRNFRLKSYSQWTFLTLGPSLLLTNILFIYSIQVNGLELTSMILGICLPFMAFVLDLINSFHFSTMHCGMKSRRPKNLAVPDKLEAVQSSIGCCLSALACSVFFYPRVQQRAAAPSSWIALCACLACAFFYYFTSHVYSKFQRASRVACISYWTILICYGLYCIITWSVIGEHHAPGVEMEDLPAEITNVLVIGLWNLFLVVGGIYSVVHISLAPTAVCWALGACMMDWTCTSMLPGGVGLHTFSPDWSPARTAAGACCFMAMLLFVASLTINLKTLIGGVAERSMSVSERN